MRRTYKYLILASSLALYAWFVGWYVFALLFLSIVIIVSNSLKNWLRLALPVTSLVMGYIIMKYAYPDSNIKLPIGYSVFAFSGISFIVDGSKTNKCSQNSLDVFCYLFFFPKMLCGPLVRFSDFSSQLNKASVPTSTTLYKAFKIFVYAAFCKFIVADMLAQAISCPLAGLNAWMSIIIFSVQLYLDFFAYSNFAIAFAIICGINLPTSFVAPYSSKTFTEFWRRWNITVSQWMKDYVYIGLGGNRKSTFRTKQNILLTFFVSGLWHGASLPFVVWGGLHGFLLIIEKALLAHINKKNKFFTYYYQTFVLVSVFLLWQLFRFSSIPELTQFGNVLLLSASIDSSIVISTLCAILIVPIIDSRKLQHLVFYIPETTKSICYEVSVVCLLFVITILFMRSPSLNFFYFKF